MCVHSYAFYLLNVNESDSLQVKLLQAFTLSEYTMSRWSRGKSLSLMSLVIVLPGGGMVERGREDPLELLMWMV